MAGIAKIKVVAVVCLVTGLVAGAAANHVVAAVLSQQFLNSGLILLSESEQAVFALSLEDRKDQPAAKVLLQAFDGDGALVASRETSLVPGASTSLRASGRWVRFHAEALEGSLDLTEQRAFVGSVHIVDALTQGIRPSCSIDPFPGPPGR